ncbi:ATP-binding cassette domain-containing protein [Rothia sp. ZJ1223]|uniref:ATP-binding cassette domain-containing protein n=1 Tax=Rothia sp. ZJ1223 TaxID=2811098 RepID=UPI00195AA4F9|nr:ATP-binding cassette domain-containing protein [Rothia sp. ZJ1223]MBM7051539.1 ATP-binding cassette domain-containing protein [Rothia sp. ZJ1223]
MKRILLRGDNNAQHVQEFLEHHPHALRAGESPAANISGAAETVAEELAFGLENRGVAREDMQVRVLTAARTLGIEDVLERNPLQLSGGQTQRVAIAALLALGDAPLLLEHPLQGLDANGRQQVLSAFPTYPHDIMWSTPTRCGADELETATEVIDTGSPVKTVETPTVPWQIEPATLKANLDLYHPRSGQSKRLSPHQQLLTKISLTTSDGEVLVVRGENGSGKTTLLRTLAGLLPTYGGQVTVAGQEVAALRPPERVQRVSLASQHPRYQILTTSVADEVRAGRAADPSYTHALCEAAGLGEELGANPYDLTLSQQQMLATICALTPQPSVLLLDEPSASLNAYDTERLLALIGEFTAHGGNVICASHDEEFIAAIATRQIILSTTIS